MGNLEPNYEQPNTVSGLIAKHGELSALRDRHLSEAKQIASDLIHLNAVIALFDTTKGTPEIRSHVVKQRAKRGLVKRVVLDAFREASEPLTSRQIAKKWAASQNMNRDEDTINVLRKRVTACLKGCIKQGLIEECGRTTNHDQYGPYKLWQLKRGDQ